MGVHAWGVEDPYLGYAQRWLFGGLCGLLPRRRLQPGSAARAEPVFPTRRETATEGALPAHHGGWGARATRRNSRRSLRRNSVHKCPKTAPRGHFRRSVYTPASPRPLARPGGATGRSGFKLFCVDVGLLGALAGLDPSVALGEPSLFGEFKGAMTEQYVAQELFGLGLLPVYWSSSTGSAEVDFAIDHRAGALPIEVKAHENLRAKSLRAACEKFGLSRAVRTSLSPYRDEGWLVNIPLWALGQVERLA